VYDVSPIKHDVKCLVHGKNLFDTSKIITQEPSASYAYVSEVGKNYIIVMTEAGYDGNGYCTVPKKLREVCPGLQVGKTYILSADTESNSTNMYLPGIQKSWVFGTSKVMTEDILNSAMTFYGLSVMAGMGTGTCRISNIQIEEGTTVTNYEPYIDPTTVTVMARGKNVLELSDNITHNGVTKTVDANGLITVKGTSTASININVGMGFMKAGYKYRPVIQKLKSDVAPSFWSFAAQANLNKDKDGYISSDVDTEFSAFIYTSSAGTVYDSAFKVMVELVTENMTDTYESYKGSKAIVESSDGTCVITSVDSTMTLFTDTPGVTIEAEYNVDTTNFIKAILTDERIRTEVFAWLDARYSEAEFGPTSRLNTVYLPASAWTGSNSLYSQIVTIAGTAKYSKVDLLPSVEQLAIFHDKDVEFVTENDDGVVTVYAIGDKPTQDYTMQAQITEVAV
jgi:hypothetical protein